ncbi:MAG: DUF4926 domain-containing protein [Propionivibrio sp.]|uniref:DUF4926 domain-containing protein n=1 Tax=Candidatus Propionivibrio dominans TaxID=2954373 RepID=A0A9D7F9W4_9RHOO|nr:DUF4926 domain-containing protein [Candidatus Propionivibrio dominans]
MVWLGDELPDVVATLEDVSASHLSKGQVGNIVDELSENFVLVEFADLDGVAYALEPIPVGKLIELRHTPAVAAGRLAAIGRPSPAIRGMLELGK